MKTSRNRLLLISVIVAELLTIGVGETWASYNTQITNKASTVASGTLTLSATDSSGACDSWTGASALGNVNPSCTTMPISAGPYFPSQSSAVNFAVENTGSLAAGDLSVYTPSACTPAYPPTATACDAMEFYIQETNTPISIPNLTLTAGSTSATYTGTLNAGVTTTMQITGTGIPALTLINTINTGTKTLTLSNAAQAAETNETASAASAKNCFYPTEATGSCAFTYTNIPIFNDLGNAGSMTGFTTTYTGANRLLMGGEAALATRYFTFGFLLPTTASAASFGNEFQGSTATFSLTWHLDEQAAAGDQTAP